jgi:hypothetical protein
MASADEAGRIVSLYDRNAAAFDREATEQELLPVRRLPDPLSWEGPARPAKLQQLTPPRGGLLLAQPAPNTIGYVPELDPVSLDTPLSGGTEQRCPP